MALNIGVAKLTAPNAIGSVNTIPIGPELTNVMWLIHQLAVSCNPAALIIVAVAVGPFQCCTPGLYQSGVTAAGEPPIPIRSHDKMYVTITAPPANAELSAVYYYEEVPA